MAGGRGGAGGRNETEGGEGEGRTEGTDRTEKERREPPWQRLACGQSRRPRARVAPGCVVAPSTVAAPPVDLGLGPEGDPRGGPDGPAIPARRSAPVRRGRG